MDFRVHDYLADIQDAELAAMTGLTRQVFVELFVRYGGRAPLAKPYVYLSFFLAIIEFIFMNNNIGIIYLNSLFTTSSILLCAPFEVYFAVVPLHGLLPLSKNVKLI